MVEKILEFIREINPYEDIEENTQLISGGILDSLTLVLLINEIENEYRIQIPEEMLKPEYFETPNQIVEFIEKICNMK